MSTVNRSEREDAYWAADLAEDMPGRLKTKFLDWLDYAERFGIAERMRRGNRLWYGLDAEGGRKNSASVSFAGSQNEEVLIRANDYRSTGRRVWTMATSTALAVDAMAAQDTPQASTETELCRQILDYELDEGGLERSINSASERAWVHGEGWAFAFWNPGAGDIVGSLPPLDESGQKIEKDLETGQYPTDPSTGATYEETPVYSGNIEYRRYTAIDVAREVFVSEEERKWVIIREWVPKWDLAAKFKDVSREIIDYVPEEKLARGLVNRTKYTNSRDTTMVLTLYHERSPALPNGRCVIICGDAVLFDGPIQYETLPGVTIRPSEFFDHDVGYADGWDLMGLQQLLDAGMSSVATTQDLWANPSLVAARGQSVSVRDIGNGAQILEYTADGMSAAPAPLKMPDIPATTLQSIELYQQLIKRLSGMNSVAQGEPDASVTSGAHAALYAAAAVQFASPYQASRARAAEKLCMHVVRIIQRYATTERQVKIVGVDKAAAMRSYTGKDVGNVRHVRVKLGNPQMRTTEGKLHVLELMLKNFPQAFSPEKAMNFFNDGRLDPLNRRHVSQERLIKQENQNLLEGKPVKALITDMHQEHIPDHVELLANPDVRNDQRLVDAILAHIKDEHDYLWSMCPPSLQMSCGIPPYPGPQAAMAGVPPEMQGGPPGAPPQPPGGPPPDQGQQPPGPLPVSVPGVPPDALPVKLPHLPINPATGNAGAQ